MRRGYVTIIICVSTLCLLTTDTVKGEADPAPVPVAGPDPGPPTPHPTLPPITNCKLSEYACTNKRCVPANRYCDNVNDCGDSSDEPRYCTPCNRTYYGDVGRNYELDLHRPKEDRLPYICHLTLAAGGGPHGDLVQVTLDSFTLGRFVSFTADGCPDGSLQIGELGRPLVGGSWCGTSWGPAVYYSETRSITLTVKLLRLSKDQNGYNFDFRMEYKMLSKDLATVRYGGGEIPTDQIPFMPMGANMSRFRPSPDEYGPDNQPIPPQRQEEYYLGDLISGTYCSRIFSDCDRKVCRLQSPNFPGVYPRNLTCYYAVRQHEVPPGKHALITVKQKKGQLISIRSQSALYVPTQQQQQSSNVHVRTLKVWTECDDVQDYVTIYDGYTTRDPVILKFCGGGEAVPEAVSSGPELLVEFTTSPYGTFLQPAPIQALHGFLLEVEVKFVDQQSPTYARNKRACEFWLRGTGKGVLESPQHSLTPNITCLYHLQGIDTSVPTSPGPLRPLAPYPWRRPGYSYPPPRFRVWLSVLKFHVTSALGPQLPEEEICASHLNVWDGPLRIAPGCSDIFCDREKWKALKSGNLDQPVTVGKPPGNATILARYCRDRVPKSCDHSLLGPDGAPRVQAPKFGPYDYGFSYGRRDHNDRYNRDRYERDRYDRNQYRSRDDQDYYYNGNSYGKLIGPGLPDGRFFKNERGFRSTEAPRLPRPCGPAESFLSTGDTMTLELRLADSTALKPVTFKALYEFVDLQQDGEAFGTGPCSRRFFSRSTDATTEPPQKFTAPRDVFLYGRGGAKNLSCSYRFEAQRGERVKITITKFIVETNKRNRCMTHNSSRTSRFACLGKPRATVTMYEVPWSGAPGLSKDCLCSTPKGIMPFTYLSGTHVAEVRFEAFNMSASDDFTNMFFEGTYEFVRSATCPRIQRVTGSSGDITLNLPAYTVDELDCKHHPWLIDPSAGHYLYVKMKGILMNEPVIDERNLSNNISILREDRNYCLTKTRVAIYPGTLPPYIVCPSPPAHKKHNMIEVFSEGWGAGSNMVDLPIMASMPSIDKLGQEYPRSIAVELIGTDTGAYTISWLELSRGRHETIPAIFAMLDVCKYRCPELNACINSSLWCDGISHCPSGYDESITHCSFLLQLPIQYLLALCAAVISAASFVVFMLLRMRRRRRSSAFQRRLESLSSDTAVFGDKEVIC